MFFVTWDGDAKHWTCKPSDLTGALPEVVQGLGREGWEIVAVVPDHVTQGGTTDAYALFAKRVAEAT